MATRPLVGQRVHGFASGLFGRDSYECRRVEAVGLDWVVTRNDSGLSEALAGMQPVDWRYLDDASKPLHDCVCSDAPEET